MSGDCQRLLVFLGCCLFASSARADEHPSLMGARPSNFVSDVSLNEAGGLTGRFLDPAGQGVAGVPAELFQGKQATHQARTDQTGAFYFSSVPAGAYRLVVGQQSQTVRAWDAASRPPSARHLVTLVRQEPVVRGNLSDSLTAQVGVAVGVGGLIVAGVAIADREDARDEVAAIRRIRKVTSP